MAKIKNIKVQSKTNFEKVQETKDDTLYFVEFEQAVAPNVADIDWANPVDFVLTPNTTPSFGTDGYISFFYKDLTSSEMYIRLDSERVFSSSFLPRPSGYVGQFIFIYYKAGQIISNPNASSYIFFPLKGGSN